VEKVFGGFFWVVGVAIFLALDAWSVQLDPPARLARMRLPQDPHEEINGFACKVDGGDAPWMPGKYADPSWLRMSAASAWISPPGLPRRVDLDLTVHHLVRLLPDGDQTGPADPCTATIAGPESEFTIRGPWLAIAWLGHLAGWPDPRAVA
jgi:hypothetical protein